MIAHIFIICLNTHPIVMEETIFVHIYSVT